MLKMFKKNGTPKFGNSVGDRKELGRVTSSVRSIGFSGWLFEWQSEKGRCALEMRMGNNNATGSISIHGSDFIHEQITATVEEGNVQALR